MKKFISAFLSLMIVLSSISCMGTFIASAINAAPVAGDINGDGNVNSKDLTRFMKYLAGEDVEVVEVAIDPNGDGATNNKDLTRLMRHIAGDETLPIYVGCPHEIEAIEAVEATCVAEGNIAYWYCPLCNKCFGDEDCETEILLESTVIAKSQIHTDIVTIPGYPATTTEEGLTDGKKCNACGKVTVEQEPIPISEYEIVYDIAGNDTYLASLSDNGKIKNPNPVSYSTGTGLKLKNISVPGYTFEGWYDAPGSSGEIVKEIPAGTTGEFEVYAKWSLVEYEVIFDSPDVPVENIAFTVNKRVPLKNIELQGYTFVGWSVKDTVINPIDGSVFSDNGKIITEIPIGTANDVVVHANWTSNRNLMKPVSNLEDPLFIEDMDNNQLVFVYKIGIVENVPLYTVADLPNSVGLTWEIESDVTKSIDVKTAQTISNTISNATTTTAGWTLSEDWNDVVTATEETGSENAKTQGQIDETGTVTGQQWYVSNSKGGAFTSSTSSGGSSSTSNKITDNASWGLESAQKTEISDSKTDTTQTQLNASFTESEKETFDWKLGGNIGGGKEASIGANVGVKDGVGSAGVSAGAKKTSSWGINGEVGGSKEKSHSATIAGGIVDTQSSTIAAARSQGVTATMNGTHGTEVNEVSENHYDISATSSSNWNTTSGYETSETVSKNQTVSKSISELIYNKYGISSSKSVGGSDVKTESTGRTSGTEDQYSSTVEYSTSEITTVKQKLTNVSSGYGYYRVVQAATAHVFAVVGFDIATQSFYTTTHTIVDNESAKIFIDHSRHSSNFDDCENGVLEFEIPFDLYKFTTRAMMRSDGLKINYETGIVERYDGKGGNIVIPEYAVDYNSDTEKYSVTRVTGIAASAFTGNESITGIILPDYITEIPAGAFAGCTNLESLVSYGVTKIGANAFKDCRSLEHYSIDRFVTELGDNAFENVNSIDVVAANDKVVDAAIKSGAKNISIDVSYVEESLDNKTIDIGAIESFRFLGNKDKEYSNLKIVSEAGKTTLGDLVLKNNTDTPIKLAAEKVNLNSVSVIDAPGFALILTGENVDLTIDGTNSLGSQGENTVLCRNVSIKEQNSGSIGKIDVVGNILVCAESITGANHINISDGKIKYISESEFNNYLSSSVITFDPNGGTLSENQITKIVYYGQTYGELPVPTREHYSFTGWCTQNNGGTEITASSPVESLVNQTLYAQWAKNEYKVNFDANGGSVGTASKMVESGGTYGDLPVPTRTGWTFKGWYTAASGGTQITASSTVSILAEQTLYARWQVNSYTVSWSAGTGYSIVVKRTSSPNAGASIGNLSSGTTVYYGDVINVTYTASTGYSISSKGSTAITVTGNVTSSTICASATANSYTYTIKYVSTNGTDLGSSSATYKFGTTNTISAPAKTGYTTPSSQSVKWDATSKTITFRYTPQSVSTSQRVQSGGVWYYTGSNDVIYYDVDLQYQNRTANSVQVRMVWTNTIRANSRYSYYQAFNVSDINGVGVYDTDYQIVASGTWSGTSSSARSSTAYSKWYTIPVSSNAATLKVGGVYWREGREGDPQHYTYNINIPAY
ncbi:MAG: hypothetical protein E7555_03690 [Ruminococcaceae bacterium]|nr:hypothetical protein [Oscillospiraceae bacterium]